MKTSGILRVLGISLWLALFVTQAEAGLFYQGVTTNTLFWTGGVVPYEFVTNLTAAQKQIYLDGLREWELAANVKLVPRTNQSQYILLRFTFQGGTNMFTLGTPNVLTVDSLRRNQIAHEMGHALGLQHEHVRPDRDSFITVNFSNLFSGASNFYVISTNETPFGAYDFESTMHYGARIFANDPNQDVLAPKPAYFAKYHYRIANLAVSVGDRAAMAYLYGPPLTPLTNVVTNTRDTGFGSLRAAIYYANDHPGTTVTFNIPTNDPGFTNGVWTIQPTGELPPLVADGTVIDGGTQPGYTNHPVVALDGSALPPEAYSSSGLYVYAANCALKKLALVRYTYCGVLFSTVSATNNAVTGCHVGVNADGTNAAPNAYQGVGVFLGAHHNRIGGTNAGERNVISGNTQYGILFADTNSSANTVAGNFIGTDFTGTRAIGNQSSGIGIFATSASNLIGGFTTAARNVISGNGEYGIYLGGALADANVIAGNFIGTDAAGTIAVSNAAGGIDVVAGAVGTVIGGTNAAARNVISGNGGYGVRIADFGTDGTFVRANFIGTSSNGMSALPNDTGVGIFSQAKNTVVGGTSAGERNFVSGNRYTGVFVGDANTTGTIIRGNYVGVATNGTSALGNGGAGIYLLNGPQNSVIGGTVAGSANVISGNGYDGVSFFGDGVISNSVTGNFIGTDRTGSNAVPNGFSGVSLVSGPRNNTIGGLTVAERNLISGNTYNGVYLGGAGTAGNRVLGNFIGTKTNGTSALGNGSDSVALVSGASSNTIGGTSAAARNVIAAGPYTGVYLADAGTTGNLIQGNFIGTDATGNAPLGHGYEGVALVAGASGNIIGGAVAGAGNVIGASGYRGIYFADTNTTGNLVQGNFIGVGANGTTPLPDGFEGIAFVNGARSNVIGLALDGSGASNRIAFNTYSGIYVGDAGTFGNTIRGNNIYSNGALGINLIGGVENGSGVTTNDVNDADSGPNGLQNFPVLTNVFVSGANTILNGKLNSTPSRAFLIDFYRNTAADPSGNGEGEVYAGSITVTTAASGNVNFSASVSGTFSNQWFATTATDLVTGDTSEFSAVKLSTNGPAPPKFTGLPSLTSTGFVMNALLVTGQLYRIQGSSNLTQSATNPAAWLDLTNFAASATNFVFRDRTATNFPRRFYRMISP